jgi:hypothetical protein
MKTRRYVTSLALAAVAAVLGLVLAGYGGSGKAPTVTTSSGLPPVTTTSGPPPPSAGRVIKSLEGCVQNLTGQDSWLGDPGFVGNPLLNRLVKQHGQAPYAFYDARFKRAFYAISTPEETSRAFNSADAKTIGPSILYPGSSEQGLIVVAVEPGGKMLLRQYGTSDNLALMKCLDSAPSLARAPLPGSTPPGPVQPSATTSGLVQPSATTSGLIQPSATTSGPVQP